MRGKTIFSIRQACFLLVVMLLFAAAACRSALIPPAPATVAATVTVTQATDAPTHTLVVQPSLSPIQIEPAATVQPTPAPTTQQGIFGQVFASGIGTDPGCD
ncbi:MAG: hypothetical protein AB1801_26250, partial [Chloroflexota bacterium]